MTSRLVVPVLAFAQVTWACEQIAVLSPDARYMLLDGDTLETVDVGNLWWKGVWGIDVVLPGSTSERSAFVSDRLSGEFSPPTGNFAAPSALVVLKNLTKSAGTAMDLAVTFEYEFQIGDARWIHGTDELLVWQKRKSLLSVLDKGLNSIDAWTSNNVSGAMTACREAGRLFVGVRGNLITRENFASGVELLDRPQGVRGCKVEGLASGCRTSVGCRRDDEYEKVIVDIASNRMLSKMQFDEFVPGADERQVSLGIRRHMASVALFAGGSRLLRQLEVWTPDPPGSDSYRVSPGHLLRVLDTASGATVVENSRAPLGTVSRVFFSDGNERIVLSAAGRVHLMDLNTLKLIASVEVPFGRHFVF